MEEQEKGICRLSIIPVRATGSDRSEMVNQLLFGDHYTILEIADNNNWIRIRIAFDQYEGWIDVNQHYRIPDEYFDHLSTTEFKICTDLTSSILFKKHLVQIVIGSVLPISSSELFEINEKLAFNGEAKNMGERRDFEYLQQIAKKYLYSPYLWGGKTPFGIDCSGFTQQVFRICGYHLKRDSKDQAKQGVSIDRLFDAKPGDLACFSNKSGDVTHIGILMENHRIIHASGYVRIDRLDEKGIFNESLLKHTHEISGIRRVISF